MAISWPEVLDKMDAFGIPVLMPAASGHREPTDVFFDAATWQWMGRSKRGDGEHVICRQLPDGRWTYERLATGDDNAKIDAARAASRCGALEVVR